MNTKNIEVIQPIQPQPALAAEEVIQDNRPFLTSPQSKLITWQDLKTNVIPVYSEEAERLISQVELISLTRDMGQEIFPGELITTEKIMVSHAKNNRIPSARDKKVSELLESDKTLRYDRCAWYFEFPNITTSVDGKPMTLVFGGIKNYEDDNFNVRKSRRRGEAFKFFIGFKVQVCLNLCVWSDGYNGEIRAKTIQEMEMQIRAILENYLIENDIKRMQRLNEYHLTEKEFCTFLGKCRMYGSKTTTFKKNVPELLIQDNQFNTVAKSYNKDKNFGGNEDGISAWNLYNNLTHAVKSSNIGQFMDRNVNSGQIIEGLIDAKVNPESEYNWYLN